jgi:glutamyl-tRNA synthetase
MAAIVRKGRTGRPPALRLRTDATAHSPICCTAVHRDRRRLLVRLATAAAYNLAVVVGRRCTGRVRGDDLLASSPRQAYLARLLGYLEPTYAHVALVLNEDGARLAKRDGAVTLAEIGARQALAQIAESLGWQASSPDEMLAQFDPAKLPRQPWIYRP